MSWTLTIDSGPWLERLRHIEQGLGATQKIHERIVIALQRHVFKNLPSSPALSAFTMLSRSGSAPLQDTRSMVQSVTGSNPAQIATGPLTLNAASLAEATLGSKHPGAKRHNEGGTVRSSGKLLTLPATKEARKAGSASRFPRDLFFVPTRSSYSGPARGWLAEGRGEGLRRHYLLTTETTIPQRRWFPTTQQAEPIAMRVIELTLTDLAAGRDPGKAA